MPATKNNVKDKIWFRYSFENLLAWLFLYLVIGPFLEGIPFIAPTMNVFFGAILLFAVTAMNRESKMLKPAVIIMALTFSFYLLDLFEVINFSTLGLLILKTAYYFILVFSFTKYIFAHKRVDVHLICAALCLYLFVGLLWGGLYHLLELIVPNSFSGILLENATTMKQAGHFNYFSFITMSTLGYGDITPQTHQAAALCQAQAILGQFISVVLIARLVGIQIAQEFSTEEEKLEKIVSREYEQAD